MMKTTTLIATFVTFALTSCLLPYSAYASESGTQKQIDELLKLVKAQAHRIDELESLLDIDSIKRRRRALGLLDCPWKSGPGRCGNGKWYRDANGLTVDQCKNECVKDGPKCFAIDFGNGYCNLFTKDQCSSYNTDKKYTHYMKPSSCDKPSQKRCSNERWSVESLAPKEERSGYPAIYAFDGKSDNDAGKSFISLSKQDLTFVLDLGKTETFSSVRFYGVNDGDQAEHAVILCGKYTDGKGKKGVAEVDIPRSPTWVRSPNFECESRYVTFYVRDAHAHSGNIRLAEIQLYGCQPAVCPAKWFKFYADGPDAATPITSERVFDGDGKSTVVLNDLRVGQNDDFVLEADIWIEKPTGSFNNIATHHLKSYGETCNQGSSWNVNVGYAFYIHSSGDIKFLMGNGLGTSRDVDLNGGKLKPKTWTKIKVTFLKGVATLYVDCEAKASAKFDKGARQIGAKIPTKVGQYGCDKLKSYFKGKMRFFSVYKPTAKRYFPSFEEYNEGTGVRIQNNDAVVTLGTESDIALVRTGPGRAAFIGDISFSGGMVARIDKDLRKLKDEVAKLAQ